MRKTVVAIVVLGGFAALWVGDAAEAGKTPPAPSVDTGVVYFAGSSGVSSMKPDGTGKAVLFSWSDIEQLGCTEIEHTFEPSWGVYGGQRWFLVVLPVPDGSGGTDTWPDGSTRVEVYAVTASGETVRLTDGHQYAADGSLLGWVAPWALNSRWAKDGSTEDGKVSFPAQKYDQDGVLVEGECGLYVVAFDPADLPGATSLDLAPSQVELVTSSGDPVPFPADDDHMYANWGYDWSPDGTSFVFVKFEDPTTTETEWGVWRADLDGGAWVVSSSTRLAAGNWPRWSHTGDSAKDRVIFNGPEGIRSMKPDGSDQKTLVPQPASTPQLNKRVICPCWSPKMTNILYHYEAHRADLTGDFDVYRAASDGSGQKNLTGDTKDTAWPVGWRAE